uniref:Amino acid transporter transmembrane domain-containing protein n=2 Tax=Auxenochlorella protothecoides TaxID=3075 RepID=A0A1D2A8A4_AUXPR
MEDEQRTDLEALLIPRKRAEEEEERELCYPNEPLSPGRHGLRVTSATANLATTIMGAGIMALPRAFATLGLGLGFGLLMAVFALSFFSLDALVRCAAIARRGTYAELVHAEFGMLGSRLLEGSIVLNNAGTMIIYLIIIADVLVGVPPHYSGLVTNLVGIHDPAVWYVSRPVVVGALCVLCLAPLLSLRDLALLAPASTAAVGVAGAFALSVLGIAGRAAWTGRLAAFRWLPSAEALGGSPARIALTLLSVLPVISLSFVCHYNILPLAASLQRFSDRRMAMVIRRALAVCTTVFTLVAGGGYMLFGPDTDANILNNLTPEGLAAFVPHTFAAVLSIAVRAGYCLCLVATFAMLNWALRQTLSRIALGVDMPEGAAFYAVSYSILAVLYVVSIAFPSVWGAMSLTGATAAVMVAFILPGALVVRLERESHLSRALGYLCVGLGLVMGVVGVANTLWLSKL